MHPATLLRRIALTLVSACALATLAEAQSSPKALVYCPIGLDTSGCDNVAAALAAPGSAFTGGVDRGYDGSSGTVDLATANLAGYAVIVVPSLADDPQTKPYARLRDATVAAHLRAALTGRRAVWSGTPDLGTASPAEKTALLQNLAIWAAGGAGTGLVALLDNSDDVTVRYDWLPGVAGFAVVADTSLDSYAAVQSLTAAGAVIATVGGQPLAYGNMAAFGIHASAGSSASEDVRGVAADGSTALPVLVTSAGSAPATTAPTATQPAPSGLRALVYCPISLDSRGCDNVIAALTAGGTSFTGGVERGYDGAGGTVDLRTADLSPYGVFIVPSLADGAQAQPYAMLRDPAVAGRLKPILQGPVAVWSGTPDLGDSSQDKKNILIMNLAKWAAGARLTAGQQGLVAFQDASDAEPARYNWLSQISRAAATADTSLDLYSNVQALTPTAVSLLNDGNGLQLGYTNMASFGLFPGAGLGADAAGGRTASIVLATSASAGGAGGSGTIAMVTTDKEDYQPGDTITVTGAGWQPGETVTLLFHEEVNPPIHPDKQLTAVADANGRIFNHQYEVEESDLGVRFTLTATGQVSGRVAHATFTDSQPQDVTLTPTSATVGAGGNATYSVAVRMVGNNSQCTITLEVTTALPSGATSTFSGGSNPFTTNGDFSRTLTITTTPGTPVGTYLFTVRATRSSNCQGTAGTGPTADGTLIVNAVGTTTQVASSANPSSFGQSVTFTATVASGSSPVTTGSVTFIEGGTCSAPATTLQAAASVNGSGQVTFTSSTLSVGSHTITACYGGGTGFTASSSNVSQTVGKAATSLVVDPASGAYQGAAALSATLKAAGIGVSGKTVTFTLNGVNAGSASTNASGVATIPAASLGTINVGTYVAGVAASFGGDANYVGSSGSNMLTVSPKTATVTLANLSQTYDGTPKTATVTTNPAGLTTTVTYNGSATVPTNVGSYSVVATVTDPNYQGSASGTLVIAPATVTGHFTASNKVYDATTTATIVTRTLTGVIGTDDVSLSGGTATFADKNVGTGKTVTGTGFTLSGTKAGNYVLAPTTLTTTADITAASVMPHVTINNKVYDATNVAIIATRTVSGALGSDVVSLAGGTANFADKNVGTAKPVNVAGLSLSGADAGNYLLSSTTATATADITPASLVPVITASNKTYDGNTSATILTRNLTGVLGTDDVSLNGGTATFADKNVGTAKTVTATGFTLSGTDASNYALNPATATTSANITALTLTGHFTANNKSYDGTIAATIATRTLSGGVISGDNVSLSGGSATFDSKQVGTGKTVTGTGFALAGTDAGNYVLALTTLTTPADITPATLTAVFTVSTKVYDATTVATITTRSVSGAVVGDVVTLTGGTAGFDTKHVGTAKTVTGTGFALTGADAANYVLSAAPATTTADITPASVTGHFTASNKVYDGTTAATIASRSLTGVISGDNAALTGGTANFADEHVGTGKTVTGTGLTLSGADGGNYVLASTTLTTTADITPATLTGAFTASNKVYDATTAATILTRSQVGVVSGDDVSLTGGTAAFATKTAGLGKTVTGTGFTLSGADAGNYVLASTTLTTTADITPATVTGTFTASSKVYDGTTAATIATRSLTGVLTGDYAQLAGGTATFADKHVGTAKTVTGTGFTLSGIDAPNYALASTTLTTTANITPRTLTVVATAQNKTYDAATAATVSLVDDRVSGDVFTASYTSATFDTKNVGNAKTVTVSGVAIAGADAPNYVLASTTVTTTADITPFTLTGAFTASSKVYDGNTVATIASRTLTGVFTGDAVALTGGAAAFADKNVGTAKTVTGTGFSLSGGDAGNYVLASTTLTTTADITKRDLLVTAAGQNKVYDATTVATVLLSDDRVPGDALTLSYAAAAFADKNVGTAKPVSVSGIAMGGVDAGNYMANTAATTAANITPASLAPSITASNKVYDGTTAATILTKSVSPILGSDNVNVTGGTATFADRNVGAAKTVTATGFTLAGADAGNYTIDPISATTTADITPRPITVAADAKTKVYGASDPALTYQVMVGSLVAGDAFTGNLTRTVGEAVPGSPYTIQQGTLTAGANYELSYVGANLTITPAPLTITAANASKIYGDAVPALGGSIVGLQFTDVVTATYTAYIMGGGMVAVSATTPVSGSPYDIISAESASPGTLDNYTVTRVRGKLTILPATPAYTATPLTVIFGTATTTISGNLAYAGQGVGGQTVVPGGSVQITFKGTMLPANINGSGAFSATFNTATVDVTGNAYPVGFSYAAGQDQNFTAATGGTTLTIVDQTAPVTSNVLANPNPVPVGTPTTLSGTVSDAGTGSSTIKQFEYSTNGGTTWTATPLPASSITQPVSITLNLQTGVYNLCLRGTDDANNTSAPQCTLLAVYDAGAGFVTGGGWINSPAGAYTANPSLTGKANFGFVSKYQKGATVPTGDTEFQFQTAGLNFKSTSYDWLVISGNAKAQYKGTGTLNGQPGYGFILTAIDGSQQGGGGADRFRIKITGPNGGLVYDNQLNVPDTSDPTTTLGGGSIVVHK